MLRVYSLQAAAQILGVKYNTLRSTLNRLPRDDRPYLEYGGFHFYKFGEAQKAMWLAFEPCEPIQYVS